MVMHHGCGLHGASEDEFAQELAADGVLPAWRLGAFEDVEETLRQGLARLRSSPELPKRDHIRGFVFDPESGVLSEVADDPRLVPELRFVRLRRSLEAVGTERRRLQLGTATSALGRTSPKGRKSRTRGVHRSASRPCSCASREATVR